VFLKKAAESKYSRKNVYKKMPADVLKVETKSLKKKVVG
jgi:hypothetical protein